MNALSPTSNSRIQQPQEEYPFSQTTDSPTKLEDTQTTKIALKVLTTLGVAVGAGLALAGGLVGIYFLGKAYLASAIGFKIFTITSAIFWPVGTFLLYLSGALLTNPVTALGAGITLPVAGLCFGVPLFPAIAGAGAAIPGAAIAAGCYQAIEQLDKPSF